MKPSCKHCGATGIYHWWWCNATDEYIKWMTDASSRIPSPHSPFTGKKYKDGE